MMANDPIASLISLLARLPGIGPKSAARLVVELGSRIPASLLIDAPADAAHSGQGNEPGNLPVALELLGSMGLTGSRAEQILHQALRDDAALADDPVNWVRAALRQLG